VTVEAVETPQDPNDAVQVDETTAESAGNPDDADDGEISARDRRYRQRAQDAEAGFADAVLATAAANERVTNIQRVHVEHLASEKLATPESVWMGGAAPGDFFDESGQPDLGKIDAHIEVIKAAAQPARPPTGVGAFPASAIGASGYQPPKPARGFGDYLRDAQLGHKESL